ncbi:hypothetical protein [Flavobacterium sp. UBA7680]|uniref:hypothetical protein n=1 Tax=Flavobacterium sp. UBA7680 TaxID=1946559 RepID=UPI0025BA2536|nr:hypothetical protein [Flavobacterium sp. UBA7680]
MALPLEKYFIILLCFISPAAASLSAQSLKIKPFSNQQTCNSQTPENELQKHTTTQLSIKMDASCHSQTAEKYITARDAGADLNSTLEYTPCSIQTASYSALVKNIVEKYKYDFSETFIEILFFEDIDLARQRTI